MACSRYTRNIVKRYFEYVQYKGIPIIQFRSPVRQICFDQNVLL